jgi:cysteine desulfurase/selenocysteine lyase
LEFPTVTLPFVHRGIRVHFLPATDGVVPVASFALERAPQASTIAISQVQFSNGCRQDLEAFGAIKAGRHLVVSGSQSVGAFPVDVRRSGVDALASAGHKWLCAGYGAGFVYLGRELLRRPPRTLGWLSVEDPFAFDNRTYRILSGAQRHELGCPDFAPVFALGAASDYLQGIGIEAISGRILALNQQLTDGLARLGLEVLSPGGPHRSGQTLVALPDPAGVTAYLEARGILVTEKPEGVRIATHFYNNQADIEHCLQALQDRIRPL